MTKRTRLKFSRAGDDSMLSVVTRVGQPRNTKWGRNTAPSSVVMWYKMRKDGTYQARRRQTQMQRTPQQERGYKHKKPWKRDPVIETC
ncbi:hypothetical protein E2C01_012692 [Portunus trituberculatus]|uniref:Uncharacterized protein n=1 Tax=Portunus trituberculatus TaxID=210409 RepID=A0A5B7DFB3_PORTR|nr:hypothetical protein [Portunus trituberculatus]